MSQNDTFQRILASLHAAALDDAHWPATAALIDDACGSTANGLIVGEGFEDDARVFFAKYYYRGERRQDMEREYFEVYHPVDERLPRLRRLPDSQLVRVRDLYSGEELRTSPVYNEGLPRIGSQNGLNVRLDGPAGMRIVWAFADPIGAGGWQPAQIAFIKRLLPHIRQFVSVRQALVSAAALGGSLAELLDCSHVGIIHLDLRGRIVEVNHQARDILLRGDGLSERDGFLGAWLTADNARLKRLLADALPPLGGQGAGGSLTVHRASSLPPLTAHISPIGGAELTSGLRRVAALVLVVDPWNRPRIDASLVAQALGLTAAEGEVAAMLSEGSTVRDIALATGRRPNTVYWLLKRTYTKLGIRRQPDLVRQVLSLAEFVRSRR